jgi:AlwI restriction endonuclease
MPSGNWSFPCSPRNPAKVREELRLLATLAPGWRQRGMQWGPRSGSQLEFGRHLRQTQEFRTQALAISEDNLRWTARARFGTYKFFGFVAADGEGYAVLTPAGERFATSSRPGEVLLRQLLKWQYPDHQHRGRRWPATDFAIYPFVATARLIRELDGLTRQEVGLFCFTMRRTEEAAATAEAIRQFRERQRRSTGRTGKARSARGALAAAEARYAAEGRRVVLGSTDDYADALIRAFRYTGLFSVRGARIVVASGREAELDELIFDEPPEARQARPARLTHSSGHSLQLALGEAPPLRLAAPRPLFPQYEDGAAFYAYYGDARLPALPWENAPRLAAIARSLDATVAELRVREARLRTGRTVLGGPALGGALPEDYESLVEVVEGLRRTRVRLERSIDAAEAATPRRLTEALAFYRAVLGREVIDPPTYLEWNTWRVFLALGQAREVLPHLSLDDDLQPLNTAPGNLPDLEVDYGAFRLVVEVTLRTGADQRQAEGRPVTRHLLEAQRRAGDSTPGGGWGEGPQAGWPGGGPGVYGLFVAPRLHPDTVTDFLVALKYRVIERQQLNVIPLTVRQLVAALRPFASEEPGALHFSPQGLRALLDLWVGAALEAETAEDWLEGIDAALRRWLAAQGARPLAPELGMAPLPLPLF